MFRAMASNAVNVLDRSITSASKQPTGSYGFPGFRPRQPVSARQRSALHVSRVEWVHAKAVTLRSPLVFTASRGRTVWRGQVQSATSDADEVDEAYAAVERASKLIDEILKEMSDEVRTSKVALATSTCEYWI